MPTDCLLRECCWAIVESPSKRALIGAQLAREDLESGITTVRNLGHSGVDGDSELRGAINAGRVPGPRQTVWADRENSKLFRATLWAPKAP